MNRLGPLIFGNAEFEAHEEHLEFQYRFLCFVMLASAAITGLIVAGTRIGANAIDPQHIRSMGIFTGVSILFWLLLRGHKARFTRLAWSYEAFCMLENISALYFVTGDEFRAVWFLTNIPGVYLLLGQRAGFVISAFTFLGLALGNPILPAPYSPTALITLLSSVVFLAVFFHFYADRSISYYVRMRDSNRQLYHMAMHDPLTGVFNARAYYQICDRLIAQGKRSQAPYAVLFVDLDHFKQINDRHGHATGDLVLKKTAECIRTSIRASDTMGRVGGEEFSVFLPDTPNEGALRVAEHLRASVEQMSVEIAPGQMLRLTASVGVACGRGGEQTLHEIQEKADLAMYDAKKAGRNRVSSL